jgi:hypothetical protein
VTQEAEIRRITVQSQPGQIVHKTLSQKEKQSQKLAGGVAQGIDPEFEPQYHTKKDDSIQFPLVCVIVTNAASHKNYIYIYIYIYT